MRISPFQQKKDENAFKSAKKQRPMITVHVFIYVELHFLSVIWHEWTEIGAVLRDLLIWQ